MKFKIKINYGLISSLLHLKFSSIIYFDFAIKICNKQDKDGVIERNSCYFSSDSIGFHIHSPLVESERLSHITRSQVLLKLDSVQPSGSFKIRGIGKTCQRVIFF